MKFWSDFKRGIEIAIITELLVGGIILLLTIGAGLNLKIEIGLHGIGLMLAICAGIVWELAHDRQSYREFVEEKVNQEFGNFTLKAEAIWKGLEDTLAAKMEGLYAETDSRIQVFDTSMRNTATSYQRDITAIVTEAAKRIESDIHDLREWYDQKTRRLVEHVAIGTKNGKFEAALGMLRDNSLGDLRWAIAKFVSHRIYRSFETADKQIAIEDVDADEYSELLGSLIGECRKSIYMTCPYTPCQWFRTLDFEDCKKCALTANECKGKIFTVADIRDRARHLLDFYSANVTGSKVRLFNVDDGQFAFFADSQNRRVVEAFLQYKDESGRIVEVAKDHNVLVKLATQESLNPHKFKELDSIVDDDFNVLDERLVVMWDPDEHLVGKCTLILDKDAVPNYVRVFENHLKPNGESDLVKRIGLRS